MQLHGHTPHHKPLSKQILDPLQKHLHHSCWYLKGTVYKAMASCENCETISGVYKSAMAQVTCIVPSGFALGYKSHTTRNHGTTITLLSGYSLQCTPQPTIPTNQSYYSQHTSTHNHSKTMNRELWCVWLERSM